MGILLKILIVLGIIVLVLLLILLLLLIAKKVLDFGIFGNNTTCVFEYREKLPKTDAEMELEERKNWKPSRGRFFVPSFDDADAK